jgi:hypothetical protein
VTRQKTQHMSCNGDKPLQLLYKPGTDLQ